MPTSSCRDLSVRGNGVPGRAFRQFRVRFCQTGFRRLHRQPREIGRGRKKQSVSMCYGSPLGARGVCSRANFARDNCCYREPILSTPEFAFLT